jgi:hypothetical protein
MSELQTDPLVREAPHGKKLAIFQTENKSLVKGFRWESDSKTDWSVLRR